MDPYQLLNAIVKRYTDILRDNLIGIYLHGSLAMGCFTERSDIDFLVVVKDPLDNPTKRALADELLQFQGLPEKGIEMSVILYGMRRISNIPPLTNCTIPKWSGSAISATGTIYATVMPIRIRRPI